MRWFWTLLVIGACSGDGDTGGPTDAVETDDPGPVDPFDYQPITMPVQLTDSEVSGQRITWYMPDDPAAVLFVFHGSGGSIETVLQTEWVEFYNQIVPRRFGLVLTNSQDRAVKQWDTSPTPSTNADWQFLVEVRDWLVENSALEQDTPVFSTGFSNGASMAIPFLTMARDAGWDARAFSVHNGGHYDGSGLPGFFVSAENDESGWTAERMIPEAEDCSGTASVACPHRPGHEIPLHPHRMAKMPYFTQEQSQRVFDDLVTLEIVDPDGERLIDLADMEAEFERYWAHATYPNDTWVDTQLRVVWSTHRYSAEYAVEEAQWLADRL